MYTLSSILHVIRPEGKFKLKGESYDDLTWLSIDEKPSLQEVTDALNEYNSKEAKIKLKIERSHRLDECDWVVLRCFEKSESLPSVWAEYRENLRCLPETSNPTFDSSGKLVNVEWPIRPKYVTLNYCNLSNETGNLKLENDSYLLLESSIEYVTREKSMSERRSDKNKLRKGTFF